MLLDSTSSKFWIQYGLGPEKRGPTWCWWSEDPFKNHEAIIRYPFHVKLVYSVCWHLHLFSKVLVFIALANCFTSLSTFMRWRRKWQPTPVFLRGESHRRQPWSMRSQSQTRLKRLSSSSQLLCLPFCIKPSLYIHTYIHTIKLDFQTPWRGQGCLIHCCIPSAWHIADSQKRSDKQTIFLFGAKMLWLHKSRI